MQTLSCFVQIFSCIFLLHTYVSKKYQHFVDNLSKESLHDFAEIGKVCEGGYNAGSSNLSVIVLFESLLLKRWNFRLQWLFVHIF